MKSIGHTYYIIVVLCLLPLGAAAKQRVWQHVAAFYSNQTTYEVTGITVEDSATVVSFLAKGKPDTSFIIRSGCHLRDEQGRNYRCQGAYGVSLGRDVWFEGDGQVAFSLSFQPLADEVRRVDFVESEIHAERAIILGIAENGSADASTYPQRTVRQLFGCRRSFGAADAVIHGRLKGYRPDKDPLSLFLCDESAQGGEERRPVSSCHIKADGTFALTARMDKAALMVLTSVQGENAWRIPVFVHPSDDVNLTIDLTENRITAYRSQCSTNHLAAMQEVGVLGSEFCQPQTTVASFSLTATYDSPAARGKALIEALAKRHRGKYVEFVGMSVRTMVPTLNLLSNIRYDFFQNPDIQLVYLFDGRSVPQGYYEKFVARYLADEDVHLLTADEFAYVREFLLSREPSMVGTLNREGAPLVHPLDYNDEFEFRRRFRLILHTESDALTKEEQVMIDTMIEVPDTLRLIYDREHTFGAGSELIPQPQAQVEHRLLHTTWWLLGGCLAVAAGVLWVYRKRKKSPPVVLIEERQEEQPEQTAEPGKPTVDNFWENLVSAWSSKRPKNAALLAKLETVCPTLTKREQAMCLIFYSEKLPDEQVMEILEMPSYSAYRTAKSRLRKKLRKVELPEIQEICL